MYFWCWRKGGGVNFNDEFTSLIFFSVRLSVFFSVGDEGGTNFNDVFLPA